MKPHFERTNANGTRAQCIECGEGKKSFSVAVYDDHAYCHRCNKHWNFAEKKVPEAIVIPKMLILGFRSAISNATASSEPVSASIINFSTPTLPILILAVVLG